MSWEEVLQHHTVPSHAAPEPGPQNELDAGSEAMFAAGDAEDARNHERQARAWEKTIRTTTRTVTPRWTPRWGQDSDRR